MVRWLLLLVLACGAPASEPSGPSRSSPASEPVRATSARAPLPEGWVETVTGGADPSAELPLVVLVHGLGDSPEGIVGLLDDLAVPARVVAPRGPLPHGRGASWFSVRVRDGAVDVLAAELGAAADALVAQVGALDRPTRGRPVITGFSQGGMLAFAVATRHPDAVVGAVPIAGWLPEPLLPTGGPPAGAPPIRAVHGEADDVLPLGNTAVVVDRLAALGWDAALEVFPDVRHQVPPEVRVAVHARITALLP